MELLVASTLVGIVMAGVISVEFAIRRSRQAASQDMVLSASMAAAMLQIIKDAQQTSGDSTTPENWQSEGIYGSVVGDDRFICFQQDTNDLFSYADDTWTCYLHGSSWDLHRCSGLTTPDWTACVGNMEPTFLLPLERDVETPFFEVIRDSVTKKIQYIQITLRCLADQDQSVNPITNPRLELKSQINPFYLSR